MQLKFILLLSFLFSIAPMYTTSANVVYSAPSLVKKHPPAKKRKKKAKRKRELKHKQVQSNFVPEEIILLVIGGVFITFGITLFIFGVLFINPLSWTIGVAGFLLGALLLLVLLAYSGYGEVAPYLAGIFITTAVGGLALFIIGLAMSILALWIGGIAFMLPILVFFIMLVASYSS